MVINTEKVEVAENQKLFTCKVRENWYGSLENAYLTIITPKGMYLTIDKWPRAKQINKWTEGEEETEISKLVWRIYEAFDKSKATIDLTKEQVLLFAKYSNQQDNPKIKHFLNNK